MSSNLDETIFRGRVSNGAVVLIDEARLPEGAEVEIRVAPNVEPRPPAETEPADDSQPTIWQKMVALAKEFESQPCDLPEDLAVNHDHYLHGLPKRQ